MEDFLLVASFEFMMSVSSPDHKYSKTCSVAKQALLPTLLLQRGQIIPFTPRVNSISFLPLLPSWKLRDHASNKV